MLPLKPSNPFDYSDFVTAPLSVIAIGVVGLPYSWAALVGIVAGFATWTFIEYWVHRLLHMRRFPKLRAFHVQHHQHPTEATGGTLYSTLIMVGLIILAASVPFLAPALMGLLIGYVWFIVLHHMEHVVEHLQGPIVGKLAANHATHHHEGPGRMFGVSTSIWDRLFGTA